MDRAGLQTGQTQFVQPFWRSCVRAHSPQNGAPLPPASPHGASAPRHLSPGSGPASTRSRNCALCASVRARAYVLACALELFGVGIALVGDERVLADPFVGLAKRNAMVFGEPNQPLARTMHQLGVRRKCDRLRLHRVSTMTLAKSAGLAAPVRVATFRLSWISATSFSSPMR